MAVAPDPGEIFDRAAEEGRRRLDQSLVELVATSVIAGTTILFGIVAEGVVHASVKPVLGHIARVAGALAFGPGLVFLVIGRSELFTENFFDPVAAAVEDDESWLLGSIARLWVLTFAFNIVGGALFTLIFVVEGVLPTGTADALRTIGLEVAKRSTLATFASAFVGGSLVTLLSFLLESVNSVGSRIWLAYAVGVLLALGPFNHVVVSFLNLLFAALFGAPIGYGEIGVTTAVITAGNVVGGLGLVTLTHVAQALGSD